jgi:hypothetical protein
MGCYRQLMGNTRTRVKSCYPEKLILSEGIKMVPVPTHFGAC